MDSTIWRVRFMGRVVMRKVYKYYYYPIFVELQHLGSYFVNYCIVPLPGTWDEKAAYFTPPVPNQNINQPQITKTTITVKGVLGWKTYYSLKTNNCILRATL